MNGTKSVAHTDGVAGAAIGIAERDEWQILDRYVGNWRFACEVGIFGDSRARCLNAEDAGL
jgi:hypothetical protein